MRILLAAILLLNSFVAVGGEYEAIDALINESPAEEYPIAPANCGEQLKNRRGPAADPQCQTPSQLMSVNLNNRDFTRICRNIVAQDEGCKKLKPEKRMSCNAKRENQILSSADLLSKAGQCAKGFLWDSMVDLGKFVLEIIKTLVKAQVNTVTGMIRFLSDSDYRQQTIASAKSGSRMGIAFLNSAGLYFSREFSRNLAKNPLNPLAAIGETLLAPLMKFVTESVQSIAAHYIPQYQCMNGTAKLYTICRVLGDFIMPPAFMFTFLKFGVRGLATIARTQGLKISRVRARFAEANELARVARPTRITVDNARRADRAQQIRRTPAPPQAARQVHPPRPQPAAPLARPIEQHSADELVEIARSEVSETAALNRAEAARIQTANLMNTDEYKNLLAGLTGPEKEEAIHALGQLSKSGAAPSIVVDMFKKYSPQFRTEIARTPAGADDLWVKLGRVIEKEKRAGKTDQAIKQKIDDAFKCD